MTELQVSVLHPRHGRAAGQYASGRRFPEQRYLNLPPGVAYAQIGVEQGDCIMRWLVLVALIMSAAPAADAQTVSRSTPQSTPRLTVAPVQGQISRLSPQAPPRTISDLRTLPPVLNGRVARVPPPALSPASRAAAVQQLTNADNPPSIGETVHLSVREPIGSHGTHLMFFNAQIVYPEIGEADFKDHSDASFSFLYIKLPQWPAGIRLVDCAVINGPANFDWAMGIAGQPTQVGSAPHANGRVFFVVNSSPDGYVRISAPTPWTLQWCDITRVS